MERLRLRLATRYSGHDLELSRFICDDLAATAYICNLVLTSRLPLFLLSLSELDRTPFCPFDHLHLALPCFKHPEKHMKPEYI